jgi:hypothetical protein
MIKVSVRVDELVIELGRIRGEEECSRQHI